MKQNRIHVVSIILVVIALLFSTAYLISIITYPPDTSMTPHLFPTGLYPVEHVWVNEHTIAVREDNSVIFFDTETRKTVAVCNADTAISTMTPYDDETIVFATKTGDLVEISTCTNTGDIEPLASFPALPHTVITLDQHSLCITEISEIDTPGEIASRITMYQIDDTFDTSISPRETPLTLLPISCTEPMILEQPFPLEKKLYQWSAGDSHPTELYASEDADIENYQYYKNKLAVEIHNNVEVLSIDEPQRRTSWSLNSPETIWGVIGTTGIAHLTSDQEQLIIENSKSADTFIDIPRSDEIFTTITANDTGTEFALLSSSGELWILQL